jgi:hypothetical protein
MNRTLALTALTLAYTAASLAHFAHNAIYLHEYPNMPAWLTAAGVWFAWAVVAGVGALGYFVWRFASRPWGLVILGLYAILGFGGLDHYVIAPASAHTAVMNLTIVLEAAMGLALLVLIAYCVAFDRSPESAI